MVMGDFMKNATALGRSGVQDWLWQRISAIILASYFLFITYFFITHSHIDYSLLKNLFSDVKIKIFSLFFLLSFLIHAWIGLWTVATDYLKNTVVRLLFEVTVILILIGVLFWGAIILWG